MPPARYFVLWGAPPSASFCSRAKTRPAAGSFRARGRRGLPHRSKCGRSGRTLGPRRRWAAAAALARGVGRRAPPHLRLPRRARGRRTVHAPPDALPQARNRCACVRRLGRLAAKREGLQEAAAAAATAATAAAAAAESGTFTATAVAHSASSASSATAATPPQPAAAAAASSATVAAPTRRPRTARPAALQPPLRCPRGRARRGGASRHMHLHERPQRARGRERGAQPAAAPPQPALA